MAIRAVMKTGKDTDGDITKLCGEGDWSPRSKVDVIRDIESGTHQYFVPWASDGTLILVVDDPTKGKYLRMDRDRSSKNNLDDLPDC